MLEQFLTALARPALYQPSTDKFWDDDTISKNMLEAHLNPDWEAASRTRDFMEHSIDWLMKLAPRAQYPSYLDLGCGPGLYTAPFAKAGYQVTGLDLSPRSIEYARAHDALSTYLCGSYLDWTPQKQYDLITLIYCDYGALSEAERAVLLRNVRTALKEDGLFVLDVFTPQSNKDLPLDKTWSIEENGFWCAQKHLCLRENLRYDEFVTAQHVVVATDTQIRNYCIWNTTFTKEKLTAELQQAGLKVVEWKMDVCGAEDAPLSDTLCPIVKKA